MIKTAGDIRVAMQCHSGSDSVTIIATLIATITGFTKVTRFSGFTTLTRLATRLTII